MSRNSNSYFSETPARIDLPRSTIMRNQEHKTTFNTGELIPFYVDEVLPGSTHQIDTAVVCRLQTLLNPIMDNLFLDTYYFFVPNRLVWDHWQEFCGENKTGSWVQEVEYSIPQIQAPNSTVGSETADGFDKGSLADYFGIPTGVKDIRVNALPFRAYALICNDFFRDENLQDPLNIPTNDSEVRGVSRAYALAGSYGTGYGSYINNVAKGALPFKVNKTHDYFTSCLPAPQKTMNPIGITLGNLSEPISVVGNGEALGLDYGNNEGKLAVLQSTNGASPKAQIFNMDQLPDVGSTTSGSTFSSVRTFGVTGSGLYSGLEVNLDDLQASTIITINQLRQAFQVQKFYERQAYGGTRYIEILKSMFGVTSPDARLQRPEYLGGKRIPISVQQVIQSSETGNTPQGNTAAYSVTSDYQKSISKSFVEHGYIIGLACVRYNHTYQQGLERMWSRKTKFDFYWPLFSNLGNQPVLKKEICAVNPSWDADTGTIDSSTNEDVFGYQEAWADYRYKPNRVSGEMRSTYTASLDSWHLADDYINEYGTIEAPSLSEDWIREDGATVDRVLAVSQRVADQFLADFYIKNKTTQPMPVYSIPGLIDHH